MSEEIKKGKILIVEDDQNYAKILERVLTKNGYDVKISNDGIDGFKQMLEPRLQMCPEVRHPL